MLEPRTWISSTPACASETRPSTLSTAIDLSPSSGTQLQMLGVDAGGGVLLEEALPGGAVGAAHQRQHAAGDMRPHPVPDLRVVFGQHLLGDAGVLPIDPVGMGQRHAGNLRRLRLAGFRAWPLPAVLVGDLLPQRGLLDLVAGICSTSRTTCFAGLSSRTPFNEPWRTSVPPVQPRKSTSTTIFGSTHFTSRRRSSGGILSSGVSVARDARRAASAGRAPLSGPSRCRPARHSAARPCRSSRAAASGSAGPRLSEGS